MNGALPPGTWDTHVHVFDPARFTYAPGRSYTPGPATLADLAARHRDWGVSGCVLVQPSVYGTDNSCLLDALSRLGSAARGVAVVDAVATSDEALADLAAAGVVGLRVNLVAGGGGDLARTAALLRGTGWFLQLFAPLPVILSHRAEIEAAGVPVVLDHFAGAQGDIGGLLSFCDVAPVWIKLSADYRLTAGVQPADLVARLWSHMPDRLIWGSDWPHTGGGASRSARAPDRIEPFRRVYALSVPQLLADAGLDADARAHILARNPASLLGLPAPDTKGQQP